ncbi:pentapeptide repeat-containing protein [Streptomyces sp. 8K308]|uniref:pentapeptide repeat-containing protein n=1 Tax=Streptomyces sp. 8K308 TaxID=2530388 RepID=UPI00104B6F51|nr:pentapeptide repeat-containing protein [Streptomyces sp. 8K308]TDC03618.1 pentapeptide repeat-containing protein [Streptomyces sp. 8K308]
MELISVLVASLAAVVGLWYSNSQVRDELAINRDNLLTAQEGQITDRYNAAITNLGDDAVDVRLGGIYALQRIMIDSRRDHPTITNVLNAYIRNHTSSPQPPRDPEVSDEPAPLPADVAAALTVLTTRDTTHDAPDYVVDLTGAHLYGAVLSEANLSRAVLADTDLTLANLTYALLSGTNLSGANLTGANLSDADLINALLIDADLTEANLSEADLTSADLSDADLTNALLIDADLTEANLSEADLTSADLSGADLTNATVSMEQVLTAWLDSTTQLPEDFADHPRILERITEGDRR